jgi:hypothetical protein
MASMAPAAIGLRAIPLDQALQVAADFAIGRGFGLYGLQAFLEKCAVFGKAAWDLTAAIGITNSVAEARALKPANPLPLVNSLRRSPDDAYA